MAYQALYRKYRPLTFSDVCGQEHIVRALTGQLKSGNTGHAYLFCGTRGTGKTTAAKILSRALNCEHMEGGDPCNVCPACEAILKDHSLAVTEIDAASNNGVDNVRQIIEAVQYPPQGGRKKVYIIDEVHMLSASAFNALLKTLEEPPEYAVFILCTTDPGKLPQTIVSRCQRYDFRHIPLSVIADRLSEICRAESIEIEENALRYIASAGDGSMRDALSLLDECRSFGEGTRITYDEALNALGAVDTGVFGELLRAMKASDITGALDIIARTCAEGREIAKFVNDYTWYLRNVMLVSVSQGDVSGLDEILGISSENLERIQEDARDTELSLLIGYIRAFAALSSRIRYEAQKRILVECEIITLMTGESGKEVKAAAGSARVAAPEQAPAPVEKTAAPAQVSAVPAKAAVPEQAAADTAVAKAPEQAAADSAVAKEPEQASAGAAVAKAPEQASADSVVAAVPEQAAGSPAKTVAPEQAAADPAKAPAQVPPASQKDASVLIDEWEAVIRSDENPLERMCLSTADIRVNGTRVTVIQQNGLYTERLKRDVAHIKEVFEKYTGLSLEVTVKGSKEEEQEALKPPETDIKQELEDMLGVPVDVE